MDNNSRRKSISLFLVIFIILLIVVLVILIAKLFQNNNEEEVANTSEANASVQLSIDTNNTSTFNDVENISNFVDINNTTNTTNTSENNTIQSNNTITDSVNSNNTNQLLLNNHTFKFDGTVKASLVQDNNKSSMQLLYPDFNYKMIFNTDNKISFDTLKSTNDLQNYISNTYNLNITSSLKSGNINNIDIIIFTISDDTGVGYCIFTKLNDSEVAYAKIYNTEDSSKLISDLSNPITKISAVIASMQN